MTVTDNYGWPIPTQDSSTEIWEHFEALGQGVDATLHGLMTAEENTFNPVWRNSEGTPMNIANGTKEGKWIDIGPYTLVSIALQRGSDTTDVGDAAYQFDMPAARQPQALRWVVGGGVVYQGAGNQPFPVSPVGIGGLLVRLAWHGSTTYVGGTMPGGWFSGGYIRFFCIYPRA